MKGACPWEDVEEIVGAIRSGPNDPYGPGLGRRGWI